MVASKKKGDSFERKTAKLLGDWWGYKFSRTPLSGGASWLADNNAVGDIVTPPEANFPLVIECKHREGWTLDNVLLNNREPHTWWHQVINDSDKVGKVPCLIFTRNRANIYIALPYIEDVYKDLQKKEYPIMKTDFIIENVRKDKLFYEVLITTIDGLTSLNPSYIIDYYEDFETKPYRVKESEVTKEQTQEDSLEQVMDDLIENL